MNDSPINAEVNERPGANGEMLDALLVGAGFSGVYLLHRLRQSGFAVKLVEAGSGLGGVWRSNCYPGVRVDTDGPNYQFSDPAIWQTWDWSERFPSGPELRRYFEHVDRIWEISRDTEYNARIGAARFDEQQRHWRVASTDGRRFTTRHLILCTGFASKPMSPSFPGLQTFEGPCVHTARWPEAGIELASKRVAVIGTGASGVQTVQEASKVAAQLTVFQRTPVLANPMQQTRYSKQDQACIKEKLPELFALHRTQFGGVGMDFMDQSAMQVSAEERRAVYEELWAKGGFNFWLGTFNDVLMDERANRTAYQFWREKTLARIDDPKVAEILAPEQPPHPFGVKRPSLEQDYYEAFNLDHVRLVDTRKTPIEEITPKGIRAGGEHMEFDLVILATGFDAVTGGITAMDIRGTHGETLKSKWADGVLTHLGLVSAGYPNLFMSYGPQSPSAFGNGPVSAEIQGDLIAEILDTMHNRGLTRIEATPQAEQAWAEQVQMIASATLFPQADSWYMAANVPGKKRQMLAFAGGLPEYVRQCRQSLDQDFAGFQLD